MKQLIVLVTVLATLFCVNFCPAGAPTAPAGAEKSANAKSKKICVAILTEPGLATGKTKKVENGIFVTELAKAFEKRENFRVLDREHIAKVLREQSLSASGLVRQPLKAGRLFGAQYLIYSTSEKVLERHVVSIICVEVNSGNVVFEKAVAVEQNATVDKLTTTAGQTAEAIQGYISKSLAAVKLPSAAILYVENKSPSKRLDFLEHQIRILMESALEAKKYRILHRRHAGRLAKETLLSTAGLVRPDATVLAEAAEFAIGILFTEAPSPDKAFKDTPITIVLKIARKGYKRKQCKFTFTLAGRKKLLPQLQECIFNSKYQPVESEAEENRRRKIEAAKLLATLTSLAYMDPLEIHRKQIRLAERVIYLDPTAKDAYFLLGFSLDACIRRPYPWDLRLCPQAVYAFDKYLSFPETDRKRFRRALGERKSYRNLVNNPPPVQDMNKARAEVQRVLEQAAKQAAEQAKTTKKHFKSKPAPKSILTAMYGQAYGRAKDLCDYSRHYGDEILLKGLDCPALVPQAVSPPADIIKRSVIVRLTKAGLWFQGITSEQKLVIYFSPATGQWERIKIPAEMEAPMVPMNLGPVGAKGGLIVPGEQNRVVSIVQAGDEVLFATNGGETKIYIYHLRRKTWRHIGMKDGLPYKYMKSMAPSRDGRSAWIYGGRFLCRYQEGKIYGWKKSIPPWVLDMHACEDRMYLLASFNYNNLIAVSNSHPKPRTVLSERRQRQLLPVPKFFYGACRGFRSNVYTNRRLVGHGGRMYLANRYGFVCLTEKGKPIRHWFSKNFYTWKELGGWVEGNCPLPPCCVREVVPDDSDPNRLWVFSSKHGNHFRGHSLTRSPTEKYKVEETTAFITAYDAKKKLFSKPIRIKNVVVHIQPRGKYIYMTGKGFFRLSKKEWVLDQPGRLKDTPLRVQCPDTIYGRASGALFHKDFDKAKKLLQEAIDAGIAVGQAKKMLKGIHRLQHPKKRKRRKRRKKTP